MDTTRGLLQGAQQIQAGDMARLQKLQGQMAATTTMNAETLRQVNDQNAKLQTMASAHQRALFCISLRFHGADCLLLAVFAAGRSLTTAIAARQAPDDWQGPGRRRQAHRRVAARYADQQPSARLSFRCKPLLFLAGVSIGMERERQ